LTSIIVDGRAWQWRKTPQTRIMAAKIWIDKTQRAAGLISQLRSMVRFVTWHLSGAWARRGQANVELVHYQDLSAGRAGEMRRPGRAARIRVPGQAWPALVRAATFDHMQASAGRLAPDPSGIFKSPAAFFRRGTSGSGRELLTGNQLAHYHARTAQLAPPALLTWLHR
jgi:aryl sulfotransferase